MPRAILLYNPVAGRNRAHRRSVVESAAETLRQHGWTTEAHPTEAPGTAGAQAFAACAVGADVLFACGGDGTIHDVLQGMVHQPQTALGILPLGSANALARHLRLSLNPTRALQQQLHATPRALPTGHVTFQTPAGPQSRHFLVMAGAGPDGELVYRMLATGKRSLGRVAYYAEAAQLFARTRFSPFTVTLERPGHAPTQQRAISAMAVRVGDLGGLFSPLIRGADPADPTLQLSIVRPPAQLSLPSWFGFSWLRLSHLNRFTETHQVRSFTCTTADGTYAQVQADGEWLGRTPMHVELIPDAVRLLIPHSSSR